jgi:hypothetical protein
VCALCSHWLCFQGAPASLSSTSHTWKVNQGTPRVHTRASVHGTGGRVRVSKKQKGCKPRLVYFWTRMSTPPTLVVRRVGDARKRLALAAAALMAVAACAAGVASYSTQATAAGPSVESMYHMWLGPNGLPLSPRKQRGLLFQFCTTVLPLLGRCCSRSHSLRSVGATHPRQLSRAPAFQRRKCERELNTHPARARLSLSLSLSRSRSRALFLSPARSAPGLQNFVTEAEMRYCYARLLSVGNPSGPVKFSGQPQYDSEQVRAIL